MAAEPVGPDAISSGNPPPGGWRSTRDYFLAGLVASGFAMAFSEMLASFFVSAPSLVLTIGQRFIDITPAALKDWAIAVFGTNDKAVLIGGIVVVTIIIGGLLGVLARERMPLAAMGFVAFGVLGYALGITDPLATAGATLIPAVAAAGSGIAVLVVLRHLLQGPATEATDPSPAGSPDARRAFMTASGAAVVLAVGQVVIGRLATGRTQSVVAAREQVTLPTVAASPTTTAAPAGTTTVATAAAVEEAPVTEATTTTTRAAEEVVRTVADPTPAQIAQVEGVSELITPNETFYRIDTALSIPNVDLDTWEVSFTGLVDSPFSLTYEELVDLPMVERYITICCVSNSVGGELIGNAKWLGVPLRDLVERAGVQPEGTQLIGRSVDRFTVGFPTEAVFDGREALLAIGMNGEPLPVRHGFPARLVVSGLYGYVSATKWLSEVEFARWEDFDAYWIPRGWAKQAPIKTQSRIDTPRPGTVEAGTRAIAGVAWAQNRGIDAVEVQVDGGPWMEAILPEELAIDTWRQWHVEYDFTPGPHTIAVRATDRTGYTQTSEIVPPRPDGATGYHTVQVVVV
ncbi:MAG: molybdopterin-dependent oxidoreductase [Acidimicrobiia bacterium]|nr:molybdopterin-dependent oxidoreductase [Acidimicrobiia bacterium]MYF83216.1 molybdopterin-dependent oxidoreductase [Acidimicrobiia bacterium]